MNAHDFLQMHKFCSSGIQCNDWSRRLSAGKVYASICSYFSPHYYEAI